MGYYDADVTVSQPRFAYGSQDIARDIKGLGNSLDSLGGFIEAPERASVQRAASLLNVDEKKRQSDMRDTVKSLLSKKGMSSDSSRQQYSNEAMQYMNQNPEINAMLGQDIGRDIASRDYARGINKDKVALARTLHSMGLADKQFNQGVKKDNMSQKLANFMMAKDMDKENFIDTGAAKYLFGGTSGLDPYSQSNAMVDFFGANYDARPWYAEPFNSDVSTSDVNEFLRLNKLTK